MDTETWIRFVLVMVGVAAVLGVVFGGGLAVARWARRRGRRPWIWVVGAYVLASIGWAIVRARLLVLLVLFAGCGTGFAVLVHPQTGRMVECREDLFDGITDTIGRCVEAYEQAGFVVRGRR